MYSRNNSLFSQYRRCSVYLNLVDPTRVTIDIRWRMHIIKFPVMWFQHVCSYTSCTFISNTIVAYRTVTERFKILINLRNWVYNSWGPEESLTTSVRFLVRINYFSLHRLVQNKCAASPIQTVPVALSLRLKSAEAWSWQQIFISCWGLKCVEIYFNGLYTFS
jgi:hypothetical protein